jgi:hypothetical protein
MGQERIWAWQDSTTTGREQAGHDLRAPAGLVVVAGGAITRTLASYLQVGLHVRVTAVGEDAVMADEGTGVEDGLGNSMGAGDWALSWGGPRGLMGNGWWCRPAVPHWPGPGWFVGEGSGYWRARGEGRAFWVWNVGGMMRQ